MYKDSIEVKAMAMMIKRLFVFMKFMNFSLIEIVRLVSIIGSN